MVIKCACFRIPILEDYEDDEDYLEKKLNNSKSANPSPQNDEKTPHKNDETTIEAKELIETTIDSSQKLNPV